MNYTNAQFRSILNGLGNRQRISADNYNFPLTVDNSPLKDDRTLDAIKNFQRQYKDQLKVDGIAGPKTMDLAEAMMRILQYELNIVLKAGIPASEPFYGPKTVAAVKEFQALNNLPQDGIACHRVRVKLHSKTQEMTKAAG